MLKIKTREIIEFYDHCSLINKEDSNTVSVLAGEDLGLALLCHYFRSMGNQAAIVSHKCKGSGNNGHRLDAWVSRITGNNKILYQVEIKNWSAHSLNSQPLDIAVSPQEVQDYKIKRWNTQWVNGDFREVAVRKVLELMGPPQGYTAWPVLPLVCYWYPIHPTGGQDFFFTQPITGQPFPSVEIFSMSAYLRSLTAEELTLPDMPRAERRIKVLKNLFEV
ncbi:MAG: hypothetical protein NTY45_06410 [Elusimicrobia bacterium]|nr:hypothetical protein [Elusimicrobiota bacterium]